MFLFPTGGADMLHPYGSAEATNAAFAAAAVAAYSAGDAASFFRVPSAGFGGSGGRKRKPDSPYGPHISSVIRLSPTSLVSFANGSCSSSASGSYGHLSAGKHVSTLYSNFSRSTSLWGMHYPPALFNPP